MPPLRSAGLQSVVKVHRGGRTFLSLVSRGPQVTRKRPELRGGDGTVNVENPQHADPQFPFLLGPISDNT